MKLDIHVTYDVPPQRFITGADSQSPEPLAMFKPHMLMVLPPNDLEVEIAGVTTCGDLSGYTIGQMLRAIADDVEAADTKLNPPKTIIRAATGGTE